MKCIQSRIAFAAAGFAAAMGVLFIVICLVLFSGRADTEDIPQLSQLRGVSDAETLVGSERAQLVAKWGEPDAMLSGLYGDIWGLNGNDEVVAYYDDNGVVELIRYIHNMKAEVIDANGNSVLVRPCAGEAELGSSNRIAVSYSELSEDITSKFTKGAILLISYDGSISENYPAQITANYGIRVLD